MNEEDLKQKKLCGYFVNGILEKEKIDLVIGISYGNRKQEGDKLKLFVDLLNDQKYKFNSIEFMVCAYIQRHYHGFEYAELKYKKWIEDNSEILKYLKIPYKIVNWKDVIETNEYKVCHQKILQIMNSDNSFSLKVKNLAVSHKQKASEEKAIEYLLEEAAYFLKIGIHLSYPSDRLNFAVEHLLENYNKTFTFHPHGFKPIKLKNKPVTNQNSPPKNNIITYQDNNTNEKYSVLLQEIHTPPSIRYGGEDVFMATVSLARIMNKVGINSQQEKLKYFGKVIEITNVFFDDSIYKNN